MAPAELVAKARLEAATCPWRTDDAGRRRPVPCPLSAAAGNKRSHLDAHLAAAIEADRRAVVMEAWKLCQGYEPTPGSFGEGLRDEVADRLAKEGAK